MAFYVATTPIPNGLYEMRVAAPNGNGNRVCSFKIGDTADFVGRFATYRSMNPDVSLCRITIQQWNPVNPFYNNVDQNIFNRVSGPNWYGNPPNQVANATRIGKIAEKCIFGPNYGHMPTANEWFMVGDQAVFLANTFPNNGNVQYQTINHFINQVYQALNPQGV